MGNVIHAFCCTKERHGDGDVDAGEQCGAYAWGTSMQLGMKRGMFEEAGNIFPGRHHIQLGHRQLHAQLLAESLKNVK